MSNPLKDILHPVARKVTYATLFVASLGLMAWSSSNGDWYLFATGVVSSLMNALAASNTEPSYTPTHAAVETLEELEYDGLYSAPDDETFAEPTEYMGLS